MSEYIVDVNDSSEMYAVEMGRYEELRELIRCKDCNKKELCSIYRDARQELGFCAWAYRKEE